MIHAALSLVILYNGVSKTSVHGTGLSLSFFFPSGSSLTRQSFRPPTHQSHPRFNSPTS